MRPAAIVPFGVPERSCSVASMLGSLLVVAFVLAPCPAAAQADEPFRTRNLSPQIAIFALPTWQPIRDGTTFAATGELANHYRLSRTGDDFLLLDGETLRVDVHLEHRFRSGWSFAAELPWVRQYGGVLDDAIDAWHSAFHLPDGARNYRPEGAIEFRLGRGNDEMITLTEAESALGDVTLSAAHSVGDAFTVRFGLKLPTGRERSLAGSGAADLLATVMHHHTVMMKRRTAGVYWGAGLVAPGTPSDIRIPVRTIVATGLAGGGFSFGRRMGIRGQVEVHTPFYDSPLEELGQTAVQVSAGGWWAFGGAARLDYAVTEDLKVSTAPDVVIHAAVQWRW